MVKEQKVWTNPQSCEEPQRVLICESQDLKYTRSSQCGKRLQVGNWSRQERRSGLQEE